MSNLLPDVLMAIHKDNIKCGKAIDQMRKDVSLLEGRVNKQDEFNVDMISKRKSDMEEVLSKLERIESLLGDSAKDKLLEDTYKTFSEMERKRRRELVASLDQNEKGGLKND